MKVAAYCPGDRWFLSWLSFNFPGGRKKLAGFALLVGSDPTVFTQNRHISHITSCLKGTAAPGRAADVWSCRFIAEPTRWLLSLSAVALFSGRRAVLSFIFVSLVLWSEAEKLEKLEDCICCKLLHPCWGDRCSLWCAWCQPRPWLRLQRLLTMRINNLSRGKCFHI